MERRLSFSKQLGKIYTAVNNLLCKDQFFSMDINPSIAFCRLMNSIRRVERKIEDGWNNPARISVETTQQE